MNTTVPTANENSTTGATNACPPFCLRHDLGVPDLCIGPATVLDCGPGGEARILTYNEPGNVVTVSLLVSGSGDFTPTQARQIGMALIQAADNATVGAVASDRRLTLVTGGAQ